MFTVLSILAALAVGGLAAWGYHAAGWRRVHAKRVIVNLKSGQSLDGFLVRQMGQLLFLREASLLGGGDNSIQIDGEVIVERTEVDFIQTL